ncbi:retrovirus-related pol polyprotein from transposon TNT 1-94 [Tanacetum coccineum]
MTESNKKQYIADVKVMNYLLQAIPNDIYNSVDACKNAKEIWERIRRLMVGSDVTNHIRHSRLMDEFDKFAAKEGESLESVYERLTTFVNIMDPSKAKKAARNHDALTLITHSNASSSQSHANPSCSHSPQPYYVTHPSSFVDYKEYYQGELQGDSQKDKLTTAMINQVVIQDGRVDIQTKNAGYGGNGNKNAGRQNRNQAFNAGIRNDKSNQIVQRVSRTESNSGKENVQCYNCNEIAHYARDCPKLRVRDAKDETLEELTAAAASEVNTSHKMIPKGVHEHKNHGNCKTVINTSDDDQIDSNIIFDDPCVENNGGLDEHNSTAHDQYHDVKILAYNALRETDNQKRLNNELKKQKMLVKPELETSKKAFKELEDRYLKDIVDLEEKLSSHDRIVYKMGQSIQTIHMLGKTPNQVYDPFLKAGLGYKNPPTSKEKHLSTTKKVLW